MKYNRISHRRNRPTRLKSEGGPEIQLADGLEALGPVHVGGNVSPRGRKVIVVFNLLYDTGVRRIT